MICFTCALEDNAFDVLVFGGLVAMVCQVDV